ncbi:MAG: HIG1 domain-containing protein [Erythrobacter sp.]|uniref:HIG1 domain-containing protein n=1 Tax=Erythrobacter sp. Alg231-14 TaxID=1922225 RepID=UPI000D556AF1
MTYIWIPLLIVLCILVLAAFIRGVIAFLKTTKIDLETGEGETVTEMQMLQNKAMFARIKYQAAAIAVVAVVALLAST